MKHERATADINSTTTENAPGGYKATGEVQTAELSPRQKVYVHEQRPLQQVSTPLSTALGGLHR